MSRIGKLPVRLVGGVKLTPTKSPAGTTIRVEGPKGRLECLFRPEAEFEVGAEEVVVRTSGTSKFDRSYHGTARALLANMVEGVTAGFEKRLSIVGVGYNAKHQGPKLVLQIGFCHPVEMVIPEGCQVEVPAPTSIIVRGPDKQVVGEFAAEIRRVRPPEPYKGKGIRYENEEVQRKSGKTFGSGD